MPKCHIYATSANYFACLDGAKYVNKYTTYELAVINNAGRNAVHY